MKISELYFPIDLVGLASQIKDLKVVQEEQGGGRLLMVPEEIIAEILVLAGAVTVKNESEDGENEYPYSLEARSAENQDINGAVPDVILEVVLKKKENILKTIFEYQGYALKDVADRYGGNSAAANLSNFFSRTNPQLQSMRSSTLRKIADALQVPENWITDLLELADQPESQNE